MDVIKVEMCSNQHQLFIITMVSGEGVHIYTYSVQYSKAVIFFLTLPTDLVHKIRAQLSAYC
jgi:hypothetical protein